jgi:uncharacterized protein YrzB (UPF0473 family)
MENDKDDLQTILFNDADGKEVEMMIVYTFTLKDKSYAVLLEKDNIEEDAVIMRVEDGHDDAFLVSVDDDEEWEKVSSAYNKIVEVENNK